MRTPTSLLLFLCLSASSFVAGCVGRHTQIDREAEYKIDDAATRAQAKIVFARCQGSAIGPGCGLIMRHANTDDFREKFRDHACQAKTQEQCETAFQRMIDAELDRRYFAADWKGVARECDLSPPKCDDPTVYEQLLVASHNRNVQAQYDKDEAKINSERRARHAKADEDSYRALGEVAYLLHDGPKCRSYPSAFGGVTNTICSKK